jgi:hypothetical protein
MAYDLDRIWTETTDAAGASISLAAVSGTDLVLKTWATGEAGFVLGGIGVRADVAVTVAGTLTVKKNGTLVYTATVPVLAAGASSFAQITDSNGKPIGIEFIPGDTLLIETGTAATGGTKAHIELRGGVIPQ